MKNTLLAVCVFVGLVIATLTGKDRLGLVCSSIFWATGIIILAMYDLKTKK